MRPPSASWPRVLVLAGIQLRNEVLAWQEQHDSFHLIFGELDFLSTMVERHRPDGVIIHLFDRDVERRLARSGIRVINVSDYLVHSAVPRVTYDGAAAVELAVEQLLQRGHTALAWAGHAQVGYALRRGRAFAAEVARRELTRLPSIDLVHERHGHESARDEENRVRTWLGDLPRPCAVITANDRIARRIADLAPQAKRQVGIDLAIVGTDNDLAYCIGGHPRLTSVAWRPELGYHAAAQMQRLIQGETVDRELLIQPTGIVPRGSTDFWAVDDPLVNDALVAIEHNAVGPLRVDDVVACCDTSRRTLERRFHDAFGCGVRACIEGHRLDHARRLLRETEEPVETVALRSGFTSARQLSRCFVRAEGLPPIAWRVRQRAPQHG